MFLFTFFAALIPIFLVYGVRWWLGRDQLQPLWTYPLLVLLGGAGGLVFGLLGSRLLEPWFVSLAASEGSHLVVNVIVSPLAEEIGKALILLLVLLTPWYRSATDGLLFGLAAGAGFAAIENLFYLSALPADGGQGVWLAAVMGRLLPSTLIHGGSTALVGAYLGAARWERRPLVVFATLPAALLMATLIHGGWNGLIEIAASESGITHAALALAMLPVFAGVILLLLRACHRSEVRTIRFELAAVVRAGLITPEALLAVTDRRVRRSVRGRIAIGPTTLARVAINLAYALRGLRLERRGNDRVRRLKQAIVAHHPAAGRLSYS